MSQVKLITNHGDIVLSLDSDAAPATAENFLNYVRDGHYDGTVFHRVIPSFMIQGGGFEPGMRQKPTRKPIKNEANNGLQNSVGAISMARTNDPHSASAQFFINTSNNDFLNFSAETSQGWGYCVFGQVVDGMSVVSAIEQVQTGTRGQHGDVPLEDVVIIKAEALDA